MNKSNLPLLDSSLYPQIWQQQNFASPQTLLMEMLTADTTLDADAFTKQLLANDIYQDWINSSVFGRYLHRNFTAFSQQTEDSFNIDMPSLFRQELMRHAQYLPLEQVLFFAGDLPKSVRQTKVLITTINPVTAIINAQQLSEKATINNSITIINQIVIKGKQVLGFPIRHNKRTSERLRNEVLILDFQELRLVNEENVSSKKRSNIDATILLRSYELR
ncbi:hypothetical protein PSYCG_12250 [Psychrobacter sp. G]|uniref:hypothetical protein n=1 Tax=Psychrobacter sp. G TaxID=571800 RepID=UPI000354BB83|nr:hypothetical protein [Psychrobacter sp. G]AGP49913.1 hypothetical protein PSYCG_12250 [Psychrobacter sp. G]